MSLPENPSSLKLEALFTILEKHLYAFDEEFSSQDELLEVVVEDYVKFINAQGVVTPKRWLDLIKDELFEQARLMLIKKMYGCISIEELRKSEERLPRARKRENRKKYSKLYK